MPSYSKGSVVLVRFPFTDLTGAKVRPAVVISAPHISADVFVVPLISKIDRLLLGEFVLKAWQAAGLNVASGVKRGIYTIHQQLIIKKVGTISVDDAGSLGQSIRLWLGL